MNWSPIAMCDNCDRQTKLRLIALDFRILAKKASSDPGLPARLLESASELEAIADAQCALTSLDDVVWNESSDAEDIAGDHIQAAT